MGVSAVLTILAMPLLVGALIDNGQMTPGQAGRIAAADTSGLVLGSMIVLPLVTRYSRRSLAFVGLALLLCANLLCIGAFSYSLLLLLRFTAGVGGGVAYAVANSVIAGSQIPDRGFALLTGALLGVSAGIFLLLPAMVQKFAVTGVFLVFAAGATIALICVRWVPHGLGRSIPGNPVEAASVFGGAAPFGIAAILVHSTGVGAAWAYLDRMGAARLLQPEQVGVALSAAALCGVAGAATAAILDRRAGRAVPTTTAAAVLALATAGAVCSTSWLVYLMSAGAFQFAWSLAVPYFLGALADVDPTGRAVVLGTAMQTAGMAAGPALAATIVDTTGDYVGVALLTGVGMLVSLILVLRVVVRSDRAARLQRVHGAMSTRSANGSR